MLYRTLLQTAAKIKVVVVAAAYWTQKHDAAG